MPVINGKDVRGKCASCDRLISTHNDETFDPSGAEKDELRNLANIICKKCQP